MKKHFLLLCLLSIVLSCSKDKPRVLLYMEDNSEELGYMISHEVGKMKELLNKSGIEVTTATITGEILNADSISLKPDIKLSDVKISDYAGFIMPCMATADLIVTPEEIDFVKKVVADGKPIAAQLGAVLILAKAGLLDGKKFAWMDEKDGNVSMYPEFSTGIYSGRGVVQDGMIITSGTCPRMAKMTGHKDGTEELTQKLIEVIKLKTK
jgi:putative intracellular protease/amidase